tara:strand:- start:9171 stop:9551 length:381 start_codon:yes stop_codon:yes gene_type:complete
MKLFIGLDMSLAKTAVCVIDDHGRIMKDTQVASEPEALSGFAGTRPGTVAIIGTDAGPLSQWLHRGLTLAELEVALMETRQVKGALKAMPIKKDRRDAEGCGSFFAYVSVSFGVLSAFCLYQSERV